MDTAGDGITGGKVGWDVVSVPVVNTAKSDASCSVLAGSQLTLGDAGNPFGGGADTVIYRVLTIHQAKGTTCVFDYFQRLALGARLYPGSSLQSYFATTASLSGSKKTISIPVNQIKPQELRKDMSAKQDSDHAWNLTKTADSASLSFGDVCATDTPLPQKVSFRVEWQKLPATDGMITVVTNIYAKNPAARVITVNVTDNIYKGTTQVDLLDTLPSGPVDVSANTEQLVLTHMATLPNTAGTLGAYLNDVATATYTDLVTGIPVPGQTEARASAQIVSGIVTNTSANISDSESITGLGLNFSVAQPVLGDFIGYTANDPTVGPVNWQLLSQMGDGLVDFDKIVYLDGKRITSGTLTDTANLNASDGFKKTAGPISVAITSSASVKLTFSKTIPNVLDSGEKIEVVFHISRAGDATYSRDETFTFEGGGATTQSINLTGLVPDMYTVTETGSRFYPDGCVDLACSLANPLVSDDPSKTADLSVKPDGAITSCLGTLAFENRLRTANFAKANVAKVASPTLASTGVTATAGAGVSPVFFEDSGTGLPLLLAEGNYTVSERQDRLGFNKCG